MLLELTAAAFQLENAMCSGTGGTCSLEIEFTLKPGKRREFTRSFEHQICDEGEGHIKTTVYEDREEPGHMIWIASWASREALERYMRTDEFGVLIGGLRILSSLTNCRLVDDIRAPSVKTWAPAERSHWESRFTLIDLEASERPKH